MVISSLLTMMQNLFIFMLVFSMQLLLILALRKPVRRWLGARVAYLLWLLPVVWVPFFLAGDQLIDWSRSAPGLLSQPEVLATAETRATSATTEVTDQVLPAGIYQSYVTPVLEGAIMTEGPARFVWPVLTGMWIAGMLFLFIWQAGRLIRFRQYIKSSGMQTQPPAELKFNVNCLTLGAMDGPAVFGFLRPVLLLPEHFETAFDADQRHLVLAHEAVHLRRRDNLWNLLAEGFRLLFWLNPLVHYAYGKYRLDQELSCDAAALELCSPTQQHRFARTLLKITEPARVTPPYALTAWDNLDELKERSLMIKQHISQKRRPALATMLLSLLVFSGATGTSVLADNTISSTPAEGTLSAKVAALVEDINQAMNIPNTEQPRTDSITQARKTMNELHELANRRDFNQFENYTLWKTEASVTLEERASLGLWLSIIDGPTLINTVEDPDNYRRLSFSAVNAFNRALTFASSDQQRITILSRLSSIYANGPVANEEKELDYLLQAYVIQSDYEDIALKIATIYYSNDLLQQALPFAEEAVIKARDLASSIEISGNNNTEFGTASQRLNIYAPLMTLSSLYFRMGYEDEAQDLLDELEEMTGGNESPIMEL